MLGHGTFTAARPAFERLASAYVAQAMPSNLPRARLALTSALALPLRTPTPNPNPTLALALILPSGPN